MGNNKINYNRILLTGSEGYIGSHVLKLLKDKYSGSEFLSIDRINNIHLEDSEQIIKKFNPDLCVHLAATIGAETSSDMAVDINENNIQNSLNLISWLPKKCRFFFASTANIYGGKLLKSPATEKDQEYPMHPYANGKLIIEKYLQMNYKTYLNWTIGRFATNYGKARSFGNIRYNLVVNKFMDLILQNKSLTIYGDKDFSFRPYVHVEDVVRAILFLLDNNKTIGEIYNVGGENWRIDKLAKFIIDSYNKIMKKNIKLNYDKTKCDDFSYKVCFDKIEKLGFKRKHNLEKSILNELITGKQYNDVMKHISWGRKIKLKAFQGINK